MKSLRTELYKKTIFVALPKEAWQPINGDCSCPFCKAHPNLLPQWDTMVIDATGKSKYTSFCHYPEFACHQC